VFLPQEQGNDSNHPTSMPWLQMDVFFSVGMYYYGDPMICFVCATVLGMAPVFRPSDGFSVSSCVVLAVMC
jgi:hypothetical protein